MAETITKRVALTGGSVALVTGGTYTCASLDGFDCGSVFAGAFFGGTVSAGSGLLASPTLAM